MSIEVPYFDEEACARKFKGEPEADYLDKENPRLVTAESLANTLGLDATNGPAYVRSVFEPHEVRTVLTEEELAAELEPVVVEPESVVELIVVEPVAPVIEEPKKK